MACGTPVIASRTSSLPEVVGDAGLLVDPLDIDGLAGAIRRVTEDPAVKRELGAKGLTRARLFTWDRTAADHAELYRELAADYRHQTTP
jgi:glycosyltransferase involved in cell wall biosynthesis